MDVLLNQGWINTLLPAVLQVVTAVIAWFAIKEWRHEYSGKKRHDLAEEVLALFYNARSAIKDIRHPISFEGEGNTRNKDENESIEESRKRNNAYIPYERFRQYSDSFSRLNVLRFRFIAIFGQGHEQSFLEITKIVNEIFAAAAQYYNQDGSEDSTLISKWRSTILDVGPDDVINQRVNAAIKAIEVICGKVILK